MPTSAVEEFCVHIEVWSDIVCPWCAIGKMHFESALASFPNRDAVTVRWRSFELDPTAPASRDGDYTGRLAAKYGTSRDEAQAMIDRMTRMGAAVGLDLRFDRVRPGNTFDAHRLLHLAADRDLQDQLKGRLLTAYLTEGQPIGDPHALHELATDVGLDEVEVKDVLADDRYADAVRADERDAATLGIRAVPFFVIDRRVGVSGAQPPDALAHTLQRAWDRSHPGGDLGDGGDGCTDDSCTA